MDGDRLWFVTTSGIASCPKTGCGLTTFRSEAGVTSLSLDATDAWWRTADSVFRCAKSGPCGQPTLVLDVKGRAFAADDTTLYLSRAPEGYPGIERIAK